jgi:WhiB family redox-sensing transcriptional regulator
MSLPCQTRPDLFFAEHPDDLAIARSLCGTCPVRRACLSAALERREPWGVWGVEILVDGVLTAHKRGRGSPRKHAPAPATAVA